MFNWLEKRWKRKVRDYCDSQYETIKVEPGDINFYYRCHLVASHYAKEYEDEKLALVVYRHKNDLLPSVHFINFDGDKFIDNSIGHWASYREYRFIRWVHEDEFFDTQQILEDTKKVFADMGGFFANKLCDLEN